MILGFSDQASIERKHDAWIRTAIAMMALTLDVGQGKAGLFVLPADRGTAVPEATMSPVSDFMHRKVAAEEPFFAEGAEVAAPLFDAAGARIPGKQIRRPASDGRFVRRTCCAMVKRSDRAPGGVDP